MTAEELDELREAVAREPDADAPREVLADALLEAGDPQGELIRVQLLAARDPANGELGMRERELVNEVGPAMVRGLPPGRYRLRRGTIEAAGFHADVLAASAAELRRRGPVRRLELRDELLDKLILPAPLDSLREISCAEVRFRPGALRSLAAVRSVELVDCPIELDDALLLATVPLAELTVINEYPIPGAAVALLESPIPTIHVSLPLAGEGRELAECESLGRRGELLLGSTALSGADAEAILASPHLGPLRALELDATIGDAGLRAILRSPIAATLERLHILPVALAAQRPTAEGLSAILDGEFPRLRDLYLSGDGAPFRSGPLLGQIERLGLASISVSPDAIASLLAAAPRLRHLTLGWFGVEEAEARVLALAASRLDTLDLAGQRLPVISETRRILRRHFGWRVELDHRWEPWVTHW